MQPHFAILFLVASSAFIHFTTAESQSETLLRLFPKLASLFESFDPADQTATCKPSPIETMFEETSKITHSVETLIDSTVALGTTLNDILLSGSVDGAAPLNNPLLTPLLKEIAKIVAIAQEQFRTKFPLPSTAPGHAQRTKRVSEIIENLQRVVVHLARNQGMELEAIESHLARIEPFIHIAHWFSSVRAIDGVVFSSAQLSGLVACHLGDVAELYPAAVQALVLSLSAILLPEAIVLPTFLLYSLGPHVLGEDAINGWLLKFVSENLRV